MLKDKLNIINKKFPADQRKGKDFEQHLRAKDMFHSKREYEQGHMEEMARPW